MFEHISDTELSDLINLFKELTGITYTKEKIYLFENRLSKYINETTGYLTYSDFITALRDKKNELLREHFIDDITTNYTFFFREPKHFRFLEFFFKTKFTEENEIRIWSAAASGGHEAYSMAMVLEPLKNTLNKHYKILGTDIAMEKIVYARAGVYTKDEVESYIYQKSISHYFDEKDNFYVIKPNLKENVKFEQFNLMLNFPFKKLFHIIFLRNVLIYFKNEEKESILCKISNCLHPKGYLVISLSESLTGLKVPFKHISESIYMKTN